ncbi:MAG: hypothetical protein IPM57_10980 [Oligoflexia bacterium]|nr:hypothetical protein [Oligoflexia bacterium]
MKSNALKALFVPLIWMFLLSLEILLFANQASEHILVKIFEGFVFLTSFFFFTAGGVTAFVHWGTFKLFGIFSLQFFFWWFVAFMFITLKNRKKG